MEEPRLVDVPVAARIADNQAMEAGFEPGSNSERPLRAGRIAGLLASAGALAALWIISVVTDIVPFAPTALAARIIRATPGDAATFFIELLGHWAIRLLTIGVLAAALLLGAEVFARAGGLRPGGAAAALGVVAAASSLGEPSFRPDPVYVIAASLFASALYAGIGRYMYIRLTGEPTRFDHSRRRFLRLAVGGALGIGIGAFGGGWFAGLFSSTDTNVPLVDPAKPAKLPVRQPFPDIPGLTPEITSVADHYQVDIDLVKPSVDVDGWALEVSGLVAAPLTLNFQELQSRFEIVEHYSVLSCVSNEVGGNLVGHSAWGGVRLRDVLDASAVQDGAQDVVFRSVDGYSDSIPIELARAGNVLLAVSQNGRSLTREHGFPCRVRVPAIYGMKNVKWLQAIEVVGSDYIGYWQERGWSDEAVVKTESRIDVAGDDFRAATGEETWIAGIAWAGDRGIQGVELSVDGGSSWEQAMMKDPVSPISWRLWAHRWAPEGAGSVRIMCRATDGDGIVQTARVAGPHPSGASGYHEVVAEVT
ncbi:MAG: molybdopterin-dependent oxidoreductase [Actinobacteria bacterium]|nr:molybdopterin-dependent oxidoreductase [Actinomycetota bacterium]